MNTIINIQLHKRRRISQQSEWLLTSQEALCSMERLSKWVR